VAPSDIDAMLQGADFALYRAKRAGRDRTVISEPQRDVPVDAGC